MSANMRSVQNNANTSNITGYNLLLHSDLNKGLEFSEDFRDTHKLRGLLPPVVLSKEKQLDFAMNQLRRQSTCMGKYLFMQSLHDTNEELYYRMLVNHTEELIPIVYTPTVGQGCIEFSQNYRQNPRGLFITINDLGRIPSILDNWPENEIQVIVFTDGERILGLGDLGINGMGIPIGKLSLYTAFAGIHPRHCLPVTLDVGTENVQNLEDPFYLGLRQKRVRGKIYEDLVDEFMVSAKAKYGESVLLQFEDFGNSTAFSLLKKYQNSHCTFNDDIQGTASVVVAGLLAACRLTSKKFIDSKFVFLGAGEAGTGIADLICFALSKYSGKTFEQVREQVWLVDSKGLVVASRKASLQHHKLPYAHESPECKTFLDAIKMLKPTTIIGVCTIPNSFTQDVCEEMARINEHPVIFALSNPTSKAECTALEAYTWTKGKCIFASGSPFPSVCLDGKSICPGQGNNAYIFPGVGLGVVASGLLHISNEIFILAAETLAKEVSEEDLNLGRVYPSFTKIRDVSLTIATAVAQYAFDNKLAKKEKPKNIKEYCASLMYNPC